MALFSKFFGKTISEAAGFALGGAMRSPLEPPLQELTNVTWAEFVQKGITVPTEPGDAAEIAAEDVASVAWAKGQAEQLGVGGDQMDKLIGAVLNAPGLSTLYDAWRRGFIKDADFTHGLRKARLETRWDAALVKLKTRLIDLPALAAGIQRGLVASPFPLPYDPSPGGGQIPSYPETGINAKTVYQGLGYDEDALKLEVGLAGNPPGPEGLFRAKWRGAIDDADVTRGLVEGRSRAEWEKAFAADAMQIPTVTEFVENAIRGYSQLSDAIAGGAKHGMSAEDVTLIYQNAGRPLVPHQITTGLARGASFNPIPGELHDPYEASAHEASVKPSYQELYIAAGKYSYPPLFQLNQLVKANAITADLAKDWATKQGYAPEVIDALYTFWQGEQAKSTAAGTKAKVYTYAQIHTAWSHNIFTDAQALSELESIGYPAARAQTLLQTWKAQSTASA